MAPTSLILLTLALLFAVAVFAKPECGLLSLDYDDYDDENSGPDDRTRSVRSGGNSSGSGGGGGSDSPTTATGTSTPTTPPGVLPAPTPGTL